MTNRGPDLSTLFSLLSSLSSLLSSILLHHVLTLVLLLLVSRFSSLFSLSSSTGTIGKRFTSINVENTEENRRAYRELLFTAPGIEEHLGGVIFYEETLNQKTADGRRFVDVVAQRGIVPGIKIDLVSGRVTWW